MILAYRIPSKKVLGGKITPARNPVRAYKRKKQLKSLNFAVTYGHIGKVVDHMKSDKKLITERLNQLLVTAAQYGHVIISYILIKHGADVNSPTSTYYSGSALEKAAFYNKLGVVKLLLHLGADVDIKIQNTNFTPLYFVGVYPKGCLPVVKLLLENGADVNAKGKNGNTPIFLGYEEKKRFLIEAGADIHARGRLGRTLLFDELFYIDKKQLSLKTLIDAGARIDITDCNGNKLLDKAVESATPEIVRIMIKRALVYDPNIEKPESIAKSKKYSKFWDNCHTEVEVLHSDLIDGSYVTYGQFCAETYENVLASYLLYSEKINEELAKESYLTKYPKYGLLLDKHYNRGLRRKCAIVKTHEILMRTILKTIPLISRSKVLNILTNTDMEKLNLFHG